MSLACRAPRDGLASGVRSAASAHVFGNDLRLEGEHLGVRRVDRHPDPVSIRAAEGLNAREVLEAPIVLRAKKRLIHEKLMRVAVKENSWARIVAEPPSRPFRQGRCAILPMQSQL